MMDINLEVFQKLREESISLKSKKNYLQQEIDKLIIKSSLQESRYNSSLRARIVIQNAAQKIQKTIESIIGEIVTKAIRSVFDTAYEYKANFVLARNKTECELSLELDGNKSNPLESNGGGLCDILSFALRLSFFSMDRRNPRNVMILDEPFRFLHSPVLQERVSEMINTLAEEFNMQYIIISDQQNLKGHKNFRIVKGQVHVLE